MRRRQESKGQILILILIVLLGLVLIFAFFSSVSVHVRAAPIVREAFWTVDGSIVSTARIGENVEAHVVVEATEEYMGSIVIKIRKDVAHLPDSDFHISTIPVNLKGGEQKAILVVFMPDEASGGGFFGLRGYFVELEFRAAGTTWTMENSYPPRLGATE